MPVEKLGTDIVVVGSGVAGLMTAKTFADQGYGVVVCERAPKIAAGATTRNEGWMHAGTYHSVAITDEVEALLVAHRTMYGHEYFFRQIPECVEDLDSSTFALIHNPNLTNIAEERWKKAGVVYSRLSSDRVKKSTSQIATPYLAAAYEVLDASINTRILSARLANDIAKKGGEILTNTTFVPIDDHSARLTNGEENIQVNANAFVITAGVAIPEIYTGVTGDSFPMRFVKSHLRVIPRVIPYNAFYLDPGEAGIMNHGSTSIIGINRDGIPLDSPDYFVDPIKEQLIIDASQRLVPSLGAQEHKGVTVACVKVDVFKDPLNPLNLNVSIIKTGENYYFAVPGKMTEAPWLAAQLLEYVELGNVPKTRREIVDYYGNTRLERITSRPCDLYEQ